MKSFLKNSMIVISAILAIAAFAKAEDDRSFLNREEFVIKDYELATTVDVEKIAIAVEASVDCGFTLMRVTWKQWEFLKERKVKLANLWGVKGEWLTLKYGYVGPVLAAYDGVPAFGLKSKKTGKLVWTYEREQVTEKIQTFWIAIDTTYGPTES